MNETALKERTVRVIKKDILEKILFGAFFYDQKRVFLRRKKIKLILQKPSCTAQQKQVRYVCSGEQREAKPSQLQVISQSVT